MSSRTAKPATSASSATKAKAGSSSPSSKTGTSGTVKKTAGSGNVSGTNVTKIASSAASKTGKTGTSAGKTSTTKGSSDKKSSSGPSEGRNKDSENNLNTSDQTQSAAIDTFDVDSIVRNSSFSKSRGSITGSITLKQNKPPPIQGSSQNQSLEEMVTASMAMHQFSSSTNQGGIKNKSSMENDVVNDMKKKGAIDDFIDERASSALGTFMASVSMGSSKKNNYGSGRESMPMKGYHGSDSDDSNDNYSSELKANTNSNLKLHQSSVPPLSSAQQLEAPSEITDALKYDPIPTNIKPASADEVAQYKNSNIGFEHKVEAQDEKDMIQKRMEQHRKDLLEEKNYLEREVRESNLQRLQPKNPDGGYDSKFNSDDEAGHEDELMDSLSPLNSGPSTTVNSKNTNNLNPSQHGKVQHQNSRHGATKATMRAAATLRTGGGHHVAVNVVMLQKKLIKDLDSCLSTFHELRQSATESLIAKLLLVRQLNLTGILEDIRSVEMLLDFTEAALGTENFETKEQLVQSIVSRITAIKSFMERNLREAESQTSEEEQSDALATLEENEALVRKLIAGICDPLISAKGQLESPFCGIPAVERSKCVPGFNFFIQKDFMVKKRKEAGDNKDGGKSDKDKDGKKDKKGGTDSKSMKTGTASKALTDLKLGGNSGGGDDEDIKPKYINETVCVPLVLQLQLAEPCYEELQELAREGNRDRKKRIVLFNPKKPAGGLVKAHLEDQIFMAEESSHAIQLSKNKFWTMPQVYMPELPKEDTSDGSSQLTQDYMKKLLLEEALDDLFNDFNFLFTMSAIESMSLSGPRTGEPDLWNVTLKLKASVEIPESFQTDFPYPQTHYRFNELDLSFLNDASLGRTTIHQAAASVEDLRKENDTLQSSYNRLFAKYETLLSGYQSDLEFLHGKKAKALEDLQGKLWKMVLSHDSLARNLLETTARANVSLARLAVYEGSDLTERYWMSYPYNLNALEVSAYLPCVPLQEVHRANYASLEKEGSLLADKLALAVEEFAGLQDVILAQQNEIDILKDAVEDSANTGGRVDPVLLAKIKGEPVVEYINKDGTKSEGNSKENNHITNGNKSNSVSKNSSDSNAIMNQNANNQSSSDSLKANGNSSQQNNNSNMSNNSNQNPMNQNQDSSTSFSNGALAATSGPQPSPPAASNLPSTLMGGLSAAERRALQNALAGSSESYFTISRSLVLYDACLRACKSRGLSSSSLRRCYEVGKNGNGTKGQMIKNDGEDGIIDDKLIDGGDQPQQNYVLNTYGKDNGGTMWTPQQLAQPGIGVQDDCCFITVYDRHEASIQCLVPKEMLFTKNEETGNLELVNQQKSIKNTYDRKNLYIKTSDIKILLALSHPNFIHFRPWRLRLVDMNAKKVPKSPDSDNTNAVTNTDSSEVTISNSDHLCVAQIQDETIKLKTLTFNRINKAVRANSLPVFDREISDRSKFYRLDFSSCNIEYPKDWQYIRALFEDTSLKNSTDWDSNLEYRRFLVEIDLEDKQLDYNVVKILFSPEMNDCWSNSLEIICFRKNPLLNDKNRLAWRHMRRCWPPNLRSLDLSDCQISSENLNDSSDSDSTTNFKKIGNKNVPGSESVLYEILPWLSPGIGELNLANNPLTPNDMIAFIDCLSDSVNNTNTNAAANIPLIQSTVFPGQLTIEEKFLSMPRAWMFLEVLDLSGTLIGTAGLKHILSHDHMFGPEGSIKEFLCANTGIDAIGMVHLRNRLPRDLMLLDLSGNPIGSQGLIAVASMIQPISVLQENLKGGSGLGSAGQSASSALQSFELDPKACETTRYLELISLANCSGISGEGLHVLAAIQEFPPFFQYMNLQDLHLSDSAYHGTDMLLGAVIKHLSTLGKIKY